MENITSHYSHSAHPLQWDSKPWDSKQRQELIKCFFSQDVCELEVERKRMQVWVVVYELRNSPETHF